MGSSSHRLEITQPTVEQSKLNAVYVNPQLISSSNDVAVINSSVLFAVRQCNKMPAESIGVSKIQREYIQASDDCNNKYSVGTSIEVHFIDSKYFADLVHLKLDIQLHQRADVEISTDEFKNKIKEVCNGFPFNRNQRLYFSMDDPNLPLFILTVKDLELSGKEMYGILRDETIITIETESERIKLINNSPLERKDFSLSELGIGGLKSEFEQIFRRAFVQRLFEPDLISKFGFAHVKGIMLYGPPGTGKTLIARKLGSLLNARPPKIVNGPEILDKYVGQSEENIRNLFKDAETEFKAYGARSQLHIIIFDEIDAICKRRGASGSTNAGDQVVNQLLSKLDGVESLDNILVVGMTNRLDMIDEALLRPGRFEIHLEISLPDRNARFEIFTIHTKKMAENSLLEDGIDMMRLAELAKNYTGAEIAAVVRSASSFALERQIELRKAEQAVEEIEVKKKHSEIGKNEETIRVSMEDMIRALDEVKPAFGMDEDDLLIYQKVFYFTKPVKTILEFGEMVFRRLRATNLYNTVSLLLYGENATGKSTLAVRMAVQSGFPFVKIISPLQLVGLSEYDKVNFIKETFMNAYKSEEACIILDDLEGLIEFVNLGTRFSNGILQALKIFTKCEAKNKLCVLATTSMPDVIKECGLYDVFVECKYVRACTREDYEELCQANQLFQEIAFTEPVPIKRLLSLLPEPDRPTTDLISEN